MPKAGVAIARMERIDGKWLLDAHFCPAKSRLAE
jgi:hypothetical protein